MITGRTHDRVEREVLTDDDGRLLTEDHALRKFLESEALIVETGLAQSTLPTMATYTSSPLRQLRRQGKVYYASVISDTTTGTIGNGCVFVNESTEHAVFIHRIIAKAAILDTSANDPTITVKVDTAARVDLIADPSGEEGDTVRMNVGHAGLPAAGTHGVMYKGDAVDSILTNGTLLSGKLKKGTDAKQEVTLFDDYLESGIELAASDEEGIYKGIRLAWSDNNGHTLDFSLTVFFTVEDW